MYIGDRAFAGCTSLEKVQMPDSVNALGIYAFSGCTELAELRLSRRLSMITEGAFENCVKLDKVVLPKNVGTKDIGRSAFPSTTRLYALPSK